METMEILKREAIHFFLRNTRNILQIRGKSMYPTLKEGWSAEVSPVNREDLRMEDIIIFEKNGKFFVHRIVGKIISNGKLYLLQKGDNETVPHFIEDFQVIGKASRIFDCNRQEIPLKVWKNQDIKKRIIFNLLHIVYLTLYHFKKIIFRNKKNSFVKFLWVFYWRLFFSALKVI